MPSAGELAAECERIDDREREVRRYAHRGMLPPPTREQTIEQRAAIKVRFDDLVANLKASVSENPNNSMRRRSFPTEAEARDWLAAHEGGQGVRTVTEFSPSLVENLNEMRIADDARFAEIDAWARETTG